MSSSVTSAAEAAKNESVRDVEFRDELGDELDAEVTKCLPEGSKLISVQSHKSFLLDHIFKITVELVDRSIKAFFLKLAEGDVGCSKLEGEFEGVKAIYAVVPAHVPRPIACGAFTSTPSTYFYLAEFVSMKRKFLQPQAFGALLAKLHKDSTPLSPNGKFGFHVTTYAGTVPQDVTWCDTWEESYSRALRDFAKQENKAQDPSEELDQLLPRLFDRVIPRLLRPLSTEGRTIRPVLVHGDGYRKLATNADTGALVLYNPAVWWAHNEYELAIFRHKIGRKYVDEYHKHYAVSEPKEDYEDRYRLYAIHGHFCASMLHSKLIDFRAYAIADIKYLVDKYAGEIVKP